MAKPARRSRHRRVHAHRLRRYTIGPASWLGRLRDLAFGGERCRLYTVTIRPGGTS